MVKHRSNGDTSGVQSVERALGILEVLAEEELPMSISDVAEKVGLKVSTTYRLLNTLVLKGFVKQEKETSKYRLTLKLIRLGRAALGYYDLRNIAKPYLHELVERCNETANLAILDGGDVVYIDQLESQNLLIVKMFAQIGSRGPAHCTSTGKVMLANLEENELGRILQNMTLERFTSKTITDIEQLRRELITVRKNGYALDLGERDEGVRCVAAPVKNYEGRVIAAIGVSGPNIRLTDYYLHNELIPIVCDVAKKLSAKMGYTDNT